MENPFKKLRMEKNPSEMKDYSQRKLSKDIGIANSHISDLENGRTPSISELQAYHKYFNVPYEYLLGEDGSARYYKNAGIARETGLSDCAVDNLRMAKKNSDKSPNDENIHRAADYLLKYDPWTLAALGNYLTSDISAVYPESTHQEGGKTKSVTIRLDSETIEAAMLLKIQFRLQKLKNSLRNGNRPEEYHITDKTNTSEAPTIF